MFNHRLEASRYPDQIAFMALLYLGVLIDTQFNLHLPNSCLALTIPRQETPIFTFMNYASLTSTLVHGSSRGYVRTIAYSASEQESRFPALQVSSSRVSG